MKLLIAGSRSFSDYEFLCSEMKQLTWVSEIVSGGAKGADALGERWASENGVLITRFPADWGRFGRAAGIYRNSDLASYCGLIFWDGKSRGTLDMIDKLRRSGKPRKVWISEENVYGGSGQSLVKGSGGADWASLGR